MNKTLKIELIHALAQGDLVSGQALAEKHNVSRSAISKHITSLVDMGLDIFSVTGKGYKLANRIDLLNKENCLTLTLISPTCVLNIVPSIPIKSPMSNSFL